LKEKPKFDQPETEAVADKLLELAELQKQEKFKANREKDVLSAVRGKFVDTKIMQRSSRTITLNPEPKACQSI
jgi:hypothetical protein